MGTRIALVVAYNGSSYHGFQYQSETLPTVQGELEAALSKVADHEVAITCAGRTDAGVHATGQVVHFETTAMRPLTAWRAGANRYLPSDISIAWSGEVSPEFDARFSATARRYHYVILNTPTRHALLADLLTWERHDLDVAAMHDAAAHLVGEHDFSSFRAAQCQARTPVRRIMEISVRATAELVIIDVTATAFLHHMVRNITGVLLEVGKGKRDPGWVGEVLAARDRRAAAATAPACGLYLVGVSYPDTCGVPAGPFLPHLYSLLAS